MSAKPPRPASPPHVAPEPKRFGKKKTRDSLAVPKAQLKRLAHRAGVKRITAGALVKSQAKYKSVLSEVLRHATIHAEHARRKTLSENDVIAGAKSALNITFLSPNTKVGLGANFTDAERDAHEAARKVTRAKFAADRKPRGSAKKKNPKSKNLERAASKEYPIRVPPSINAPPPTSAPTSSLIPPIVAAGVPLSIQNAARPAPPAAQKKRKKPHKIGMPKKKRHKN